MNAITKEKLVLYMHDMENSIDRPLSPMYVMS